VGIVRGIGDRFGDAKLVRWKGDGYERRVNYLVW
jgi:hypothetical protein